MVAVTECGKFTDAPGFHGMRQIQNSAGPARACSERLGGSSGEFQIGWKSVRLICARWPCRFSKGIWLVTFFGPEKTTHFAAEGRMTILPGNF
jgi:hypothetical protein